MFGKTFGVEFEFVAPRDITRSAVAEALSAAGVESYDAGYTHAVSRKWKLVTDASVSATNEGEQGMELVSPILQGEHDLAKMRTACDVLTRLGCKVNRTCGLHVHVGARTMSVAAMRRLAILYSDFEGVLDSMMPASRRANNNTYLQSLSRINKPAVNGARDVRGIAAQINNGSRYAKVNFTSHWKHGTVEFRHHAGTVAADKASNWVVACLRMVITAEQESDQPVAVVQANRPTQVALRTIYDLVARPEGATREEARVALGRNSPPQMTRLTEDCGIQLRRVGQRYFLAEQPVVNTAVGGAPAAQAITLEGWIAKLGLSEEQGAFWKARQEFFAADTIGERIGFAPGSRAAARAGL
jgi:hypothetical protein